MAPLAGIFHGQPVEHTPPRMARSAGWTEPTRAGHPVAGDAQGRGGDQVCVSQRVEPYAGSESTEPRIEPCVDSLIASSWAARS